MGAQFDIPSGKHAKSKSQNKFSQPELARYNHSIERMTTQMQQDSITMTATGNPAGSMGVSNKEKRANYTLNQQQQAQLKHNLQKTQKQVDAMLNSAYNMKTGAKAKTMKSSQ